MYIWTASSFNTLKQPRSQADLQLRKVYLALRSTDGVTDADRSVQMDLCLQSLISIPHHRKRVGSVLRRVCAREFVDYDYPPTADQPYSRDHDSPTFGRVVEAAPFSAMVHVNQRFIGRL